MGETEPTEEFWSRDALVEAYVGETDALAYEVDAVDEAVARAAATGAVESVHVLGVGAGRELGAIRAATPGATIHAWDISAPMVEACRRHVAETGLDGIEVAQCAAVDLTRPGGVAADVVIALGAVLGYATTDAERRRTAEVLGALLRPGGGLAAVVQQRNGRPDWAVWFALRAVLDRTPLIDDGPGNRNSRHGDTGVLFHHYSARELRGLLADAGFQHVDVRSLRSWGRSRSVRIPRRSPNPLIATAVAGPAPR